MIVTVDREGVIPDRNESFLFELSCPAEADNRQPAGRVPGALQYLEPAPTNRSPTSASISRPPSPPATTLRPHKWSRSSPRSPTRQSAAGWARSQMGLGAGLVE